MENMDWLSRIAPWLKERLSGGGGAPQGGMFEGGGSFGNSGWPFFGNTGEAPATGTPQGGHEFLGRLFGRLAPSGGASPVFGGSEVGSSAGRPSTTEAPLLQGGMRRFEEGGRPEPGEPAVVGEGGPEVFVPDQPGTVVPNWLADAMVKMPPPAAQPQQRGPLRSMAAGRQVADWRDRDPDAAVQETKDKWADIYADPGGTLENLGLTGQIIGAAVRNASPNAAQAQSANARKLKKPEQTTPMDKVLEEQQMLFEKGFLKKDEVDGADGPRTQEARRQYQAAQQKMEEIAAQKETAAANTELAGAQKETAKAQLEKTKLESEAFKTKKEQREKGEETLRKSEADLPWYSKLLRDYGTGTGIAIGAAAGPAARAGVRALGDKFLTKNAAAAEGLFEKGGVPIVRKNLSDRVANVNEFWRKGGAGEAVPFLPAPAAKAGVSANLEAANPGKLFTPSFMATKGADAAAAGAMGAEAGVSAWQKGVAQETLDKATAAVKEDPSEINIREYQAAKDRVATMDLLMNIGRTGAGSYMLSGMAKPRQPIKPNTAPAEAEKLNIEKLLRTRADKESKVATKTAEKAPTPSLQELTAPEPIRAHVPKRTRKKAENG